MCGRGHARAHVGVGCSTQYGEKLGSGAFKTVYVCFDRESGTQLAWNQIALHHDIDAEEFKRLYKEISILKQISHPNIIKCAQEGRTVRAHVSRAHAADFMTLGSMRKRATSSSSPSS